VDKERKSKSKKDNKDMRDFEGKCCLIKLGDIDNEKKD